MAKALYRKYRPTRLFDVVGQDRVTSLLANDLKNNKISHAYLFIGPRGTGKTSVARIFAHEINGFKYQIEDDYIDIIEIDGASNRGIDDIRELRQKANIAPSAGKYKVYIIDEVHMLTKEAFNALLKTLEEPPKHVVFIMATTDAHKVPVTITSRAQSYTFKLADEATMFNFLRSVAKKEKIDISDDALEVIVKKGGGSFRDSLSLLDQISTLSDKTITKELLISSLGLPDDDKINQLLNEYTNPDVVKITTLLKDLLSAGIKAETLAEELISFIIEDPKPRYLPLLNSLTEVKPPFAEAKLIIALCGKKQIMDSSSHQEIPNNSPVSMDGTNNHSQDFNWQHFVNSFKKINEAIYSRLLKCNHDLVNNTLNLYPKTPMVKNILESKNNLEILRSNAKNIKIVIHNVDKNPDNRKKDQKLDNISDIMGGEVINYGGEDPFN